MVYRVLWLHVHFEAFVCASVPPCLASVSFTLRIVLVLLIFRKTLAHQSFHVFCLPLRLVGFSVLPLGSLLPCLNCSFPMIRSWFGSGAFVFQLLTYVPILFAFVAAFLRPEHLSAVVSVRLVSSFGCVLLSSCCVYILFSPSFVYLFRQV